MVNEQYMYYLAYFSGWKTVSRSNAGAIYKAPECRLLQMQYVLLTCSHLCSLTDLKKRYFTNGPTHASVVLLAYAQKPP